MNGINPVVSAVTTSGYKNDDGVTVYRCDGDNFVLDSAGSGAPPSTKAGYAVGCLYRRSNGTLYVNTNTTASCTFTAIGTISAGSVLLASLATGIKPSHVTKFAAISTAVVDGTGTLAITVTGALATDVAAVTLSAATNAVYVTKAVCTTDTLTVTLSGAGGAGTQVNYVIQRAAA